MTDDHDTLIRIEEVVKELKDQFDNHLKHHAAVSFCLLAALLANAGAFILFLLRSQ